MRVISCLLSLVLIHGLLLSHFSYMGDASHDFSHKLKVVSHKARASPPPPPLVNRGPIPKPPIVPPVSPHPKPKSPPPPPPSRPPKAPSSNG